MAHSAKRLINIQRGFCQVSSVCLLEFWLRSKFQDRANDTVYTGVDPGFFLGGGALVACSTSTPINHIVFFSHPLHPPARSAPDTISQG